MQSTNQARGYVRAATPSEYAEATRVLVRSFAKDPAMNWYGGVTEMVDDIDNPSPTSKRTLRNLESFQGGLLEATALVGGSVDIALVPCPESGKENGERKEEIAGVALWLPPGKTTDFSPFTILRSGLPRILAGWGLGAVKRMLSDWTPVVEREKLEAFKARGLDLKDSWHLLTVVVDPRHQRKGISSMLLKEGIRRASPKPIHLEATTANSRDIYARYGFEINSEDWFGVGEVDKNGIKVRGQEAATGFPEWIMTKWTS